MMGRFFSLPACLVVLSCFSACSTIETQRRDWSEYRGPGQVYFQLEEPGPVELLDDPLEPLNRAVGAANFIFLDYVVAPLSMAHRAVFPPPVRRRIDNFTYTMAYPKRLVANAMMGELKTAGVETSRFLINGTIGIAGLFDPAEDLGLARPDPVDVGLALGRWGWDSRVYLNLPYYGSSSIRDGTGELFNFALTPTNWVPGGFIFLGINSQCDQVDDLLRLVRAYPDPYEAARFLWSIQRSARIAGIEAGEGESTREETLMAMYLAVSEHNFPYSGETGEIPVSATGKYLPYSYWLQPGTAPLLFILPGLGSHRENERTLALAEMGYRRGFSVVVISSAFHPEFMSAASSQEVPGYPPTDVAEIRNALEGVHSDLTARYPDRFTGRKALMGVSMGGYHTLFLASEQASADGGGLGFDRYVAISPPVSLRYGAASLDRMYTAVNTWPEEEREERMLRALQKAAVLSDSTLKVKPGTRLPFDLEESRFLIGLEYRLVLRSILHDSQRRRDLGVLLTRISDWQPTASYRELADYSWMEYFYAFVFPSISSGEPGPKKDEDFFFMGDLRSLESGLRRNDAVFVFASSDDFLLSEEDQAWLGATFRERLTLFEGGGHTGNLHKKEIQEKIFSALEGLRVSSEISGR